MDSEDMLFMLYTSGSTGKPKGIVRTQAGYLLYAVLTQQVRMTSYVLYIVHIIMTIYMYVIAENFHGIYIVAVFMK